MNFKIKGFCLALFMISGVGFSLRAQVFVLGINDYKETYIAYDRLVGKENLEIYNGVEYIEKHRMINEKHKFYLSFDFQKGTVFYDGQPYYNIDIKYNVVDDLLLVQFQQNGAKNVFQLSPLKLNGFSLNERQFVNLSGRQGLPTEGIFEVIYDASGNQILKKHRMKEKKILEGKLLHYEFEADKPEYFFVSNDKIFRMNSKNLLIRYPGEKERIKRFFRKHGRKIHQLTDADLITFYEELTKDSNIE